MVEHTPTPYVLGEGFNIPRNHAICFGPKIVASVPSGGYPPGQGWSQSGENDARFIVTACNNHGKLVAALRKLENV